VLYAMISTVGALLPAPWASLLDILDQGGLKSERRGRVKWREAVEITFAILAITATMFGCGAIAEAQPAKMPKIAWLSRNSASSPSSLFLADRKSVV